MYNLKQLTDLTSWSKFLIGNILVLNMKNKTGNIIFHLEQNDSKKINKDFSSRGLSRKACLQCYAFSGKKQVNSRRLGYLFF